MRPECGVAPNNVAHLFNCATTLTIKDHKPVEVAIMLGLHTDEDNVDNKQQIQ